MSAGAAPGQLELVRRFMNTVDVDEDADAIATPSALRDWLSDTLADPGEVGDREHGLALAFRGALRGLAAGEGGERQAHLETLDATAAAAGLTPRFAGQEVGLEARTSGVPGQLGGMLAAVYGAMADGTWERLKLCARDDCRWAFYDASRNRSGTWCSMRVCGNRSKAERHRRRRARATA